MREQYVQKNIDICFSGINTTDTALLPGLRRGLNPQQPQIKPSEHTNNLYSDNLVFDSDKNVRTGFQSADSNSLADRNPRTGFQSADSNSLADRNPITGFQSADSNSLADRNPRTGFQSADYNSLADRNSITGFHSAEKLSYDIATVITHGDTTIVSSKGVEDLRSSPYHDPPHGLGQRLSPEGGRSLQSSQGGGGLSLLQANYSMSSR